MANGGHRFVMFDEAARELHSFGDGAELIGIRHAARQQQSVVILGFGRVQGNVDSELVALIVVLPTLDLALASEINSVLAPA